VVTSREQAAGVQEEGHSTEAANVADVDSESAELLEWPAVCAQVAAFTSTSAAAEAVLSSGVPLGRSLVHQVLWLS